MISKLIPHTNTMYPIGEALIAILCQPLFLFLPFCRRISLLDLNIDVPDRFTGLRFIVFSIDGALFSSSQIARILMQTNRDFNRDSICRAIRFTVHISSSPRGTVNRECVFVGRPSRSVVTQH